MSAVLDAFAQALLDPARPVPPGATGPGGRIDANRFAVYRNNVFVSLVGALESRFPVTRRLVGDSFFKGMARVYCATRRPRSPVLLHYGEDFPQFIAGFPPAAPLPYLPDIAQLEATWSNAYHAADVTALAPAALGDVAPAQLGTLRFVPHPATAIIVSDHPVGAIWAAHQAPTVAPITQTGAQTVLIVRPRAEVNVIVLPATDGDFVWRLLAGEALGTAAAQQGPGFDVGQALVGLLTLGAMARFTCGVPDHAHHPI